MREFIRFISEFIYLYPLLMSIVWMIGGMIFFWRHERKKPEIPKLATYPMFSILVPCHNEQDQIERTVNLLLEVAYPNFEIILIDDGSSDHTARHMERLCQQHDLVRTVYLKENQGKAAAMNIGALAARGDLLLTLDADALLSPDALHWIAWHFENFPRVGAVTGNPRVINRTSLLAKIQIGEYGTIIGLIKRTQRLLGKVLTVSGVIAAFRKTALHSVGYWDTDMVTEDIDITWKLEKAFWDVRYEPNATCWIYVPETLTGLWKQRLRWAQGSVEVMKKHIDIWCHGRQRRLWPIYIDSLISLLWAYCFWGIIFLWIIVALFNLRLGIIIPAPVPPKWQGALLALTCIMQFTISLYIEHIYEKNIFRYLFWVIWYPFIYWMIGSLTVVFATPKALFKKKGQRAVWKSPDRGLGKLSKQEKLNDGNTN